MVTSVIVASIIWAMMYHSQLGLIQSILGAFGIPRQAFLSDASRALPAVTVMMIWKDLGFSLIIILAGLKAIPQTYYEAALVDGANNWEAFRRITIPLLMPVLMFVVVTQAVFSFQVFVPVYQMTQGGPLDLDQGARLLHLPAGVPLPGHGLRQRALGGGAAHHGGHQLLSDAVAAAADVGGSRT